MVKNIYFILLCLSYLSALGNDSTYIERQIGYIDTALLSNTGNKLTLKAYQGLPIDSVELNEILLDLPNKFNPDFQIVELVRVLFYSDGLYDDEILPVLNEIPLWLNESDTIRNYWTENHMIMWMSTEWLLHERYNWSIDNTLYSRLIHYLELKLTYGFYEFFSSVYAPYTLCGLLNLYEFSEDPIVKELAMKVAQRLLEDLLKPTTDLGVYFPAAGRNYPEKYKNAYGQNHSSLIYLLTGFGETPSRATHAGAFLSTSNLPIDEVINSWTPHLDTLIHIGHSLDSSFSIHSDMTLNDRLIFQWSTSAYAHPVIIQETFRLLTDSILWNHKDWDALQPLSFINPEDAPSLSEDLSVLSYGSVIAEHNVRIFKNNAVALMSISDLWKGKVGFQQWPFAATVGTTAVYTESGEVKLDWADRDRNIENTHMPHVEQKSNLALIVYRPEPIPILLDLVAGEMFENKEVALFWQEDAYDEIVEDGNWLIGRQHENYVAIRRSCTETINTWWACETEKGQTWVVMVGDASMYGDFTNFQNIIALSQFTEEWSLDPITLEETYHTKIIIDTLSVEYTWENVDSISTNIESPINPKFDFSIYPNPINDYITLNFNSIVNQPIKIKVINTLGAEIYYEKTNPSPSNIIETSDWQAGVYTIIVENQGMQYFKKMIKF